MSGRKSYGGTGLILAYHRVVPDSVQPSKGVLAVQVSEFSRQISFLLGRGWRAKTVSSFVRDHVVGQQPAEKVFAVTFDDGYADNIMHAFPVLRTHGIPATVYVTGAYPGSDRPLAFSPQAPSGPQIEEDRCMNADELCRLVDGGWEIGSHTMTHPMLEAQQDAAVMDELITSKETLARMTGTDVRSFCYPYGSLSDSTVECVKKAGYDSAVVTPPRKGIQDTRWTIHRIGVYGGEDLRRFRLKISGMYAWARELSWWWDLRSLLRS